ncbi:MAG: hypothetical protein EGQ11_00165 [Sutterella sp.]|nr:hypothetical protein [Sutterella sp.]
MIADVNFVHIIARVERKQLGNQHAVVICNLAPNVARLHRIDLLALLRVVEELGDVAEVHHILFFDIFVPDLDLLLEIAVDGVRGDVAVLDLLQQLLERTGEGRRSGQLAVDIEGVPLVDKADEVEALFAEAGEGRAGTLAVGANRRFGIYVLSRRLMHMKRRMPAIETSLMIEDNDVVEDAVAGHLIDVGFISGRPTNPDLDGFPCFEDRFAFVVGLGSPLMSAYVTARELSDATWVLEREQRTQRDVLAHLEARGIRIRHSVTMDTMGAVKRAAGTGLGVALLPYLSVREEILRGDLVEIMKPASTELADSQKIWAVWRRDAEGALRSAFFQACSIEPIA